MDHPTLLDPLDPNTETPQFITHELEIFAISIDFVIQVLEIIEENYRKPFEAKILGQIISGEFREKDPIVLESLRHLNLVRIGTINWLKEIYGKEFQLPTQIKHSEKGTIGLLEETNIYEVVFLETDLTLTYRSIVEILNKRLDELMPLLDRAAGLDNLARRNRAIWINGMNNLISAIVLLSSK